MARLVLLTLLCCLAWLSCSSRTSNLKIDPLVYEEQLLWVSGVEGEVNTYRIPLLTFTMKGSLLAFSEGRKKTAGDVGAKFIAMRRSTNRGATWSPTVFIVDDGQQPNSLNLGAVVVDEEFGTIIIVYSSCFHEYQCKPASTMMVQSLDDGLSWSKPQNLSRQLGVKAFAPGPGYGIQKKYEPAKGRLVVCGHGTIEGDGVFCILSDDHGKTWYNGAALKSIPYNQPKKSQDFNPDECQPFELPDGSIVINVRNQNNYHCKCRVIIRSHDGGLSLPIDNVTFAYELIDPVVAAGALEKDGIIYFTNPLNVALRVNLTLRWSLDHGKNWEKKAVQIWPGPSAYSCLTSLKSESPEDQKYIYVIYEKGRQTYDETVSFVKIHLYGGR